MKILIIRDSKRYELSKALEKLNKKAEKCNVQVTINIGDTEPYIRYVNDPYSITMSNADGKYYALQEFTESHKSHPKTIDANKHTIVDAFKVEVDTIIDANFTDLVAKISFDNEFKEISIYNIKYTYEQIDKIKLGCNHCNSDRIRKNYYVIEENGQLKIIGKSCFNTYIGNPQLTHYLYQLDNLLDYYYDDDISTYYEGDGRIIESDYHYSNVVFSYFMTKDIKEIDSDYKNYRSVRGIFNVFYKEVMNNKYKMLDEEYSRFIEFNGNTEFQTKLLNLIKNEMVNPDKYWKMLIHIKNVYKTLLAKHTRLADTNNKFIDLEIKTRFEIALTVDSIKYIDSMYGTTTLYTMHNNEGMVFTYFSSNDLNLEIGSTYTIKATLKDKKEYNGIRQNVITRCKVIN